MTAREMFHGANVNVAVATQFLCRRVLPLIAGVATLGSALAQPQQPQQRSQSQQPQQQPQSQQPQQQPQSQQPGQPAAQDGGGCAALPAHDDVTSMLRDVVAPGDPSANGGLGNHMWAVLVDRSGTICVVARSGDAFGDQWLGSRAIAAGKAFTANAFSVAGFALSTANLYWPVQPGNSLYGTQTANPANALAIYAGAESSWGSADDPLVGRRVGGTVAFGGGLALYSPQGGLIGALGVSGDESCTDHIVAWKVRHGLNLDAVPDGVSPDGSDNIVHDVTVDPASGQDKSASGYGHPTCSPAARRIAARLPDTAPTGPAD